MANANHTFLDPVPHTRWNLPLRSAEYFRPNRCGSRFALAVMLCSLGSGASAELPLAVEDLLTDKGKIRMNTSVTYHNGFSESAAYEEVPLRAGKVAYVPMPTASIRANSDILVGTLSLRYGLTGDAEIYSRGS